VEETLRLLAGRARLNLEVKDARAGMAVIDLLGRFPQADVVVSSFDQRLLVRLRKAAPDLPLAVLADRDGHLAAGRALVLRAAALHLRADLVSRPLLALCRRHGLPVLAWTVDAPARARHFARLGLDGLFTNDPGLLRQALAPAPR
jgi:glycerophosphoryl diester phosphodiesterase